MSWLNAALKKNEALRVILVTGKPDPNDPRKPFEQARTRAVNDFLIDGLGPDPNQRIALLRHLHHIVHAKAAFVDDRVAIVGSANWAQRGLYTDIEHSLRFEDPVHGLAGDRQTIWGHHLGSSPSAIAAAVNDWFAIPFGAGHPTFERLRLPLPPAPMSATDEWEIDVVYDANSRHHWPTSPLPLPSVPGVPPAPPVP
jgi:phosphatidylserine/phosphatidylglycerophosphate/cardiolipin synthase-like enzyme